MKLPLHPRFLRAGLFPTNAWSLFTEDSQIDIASHNFWTITWQLHFCVDALPCIQCTVLKPHFHFAPESAAFPISASSYTSSKVVSSRSFMLTNNQPPSCLTWNTFLNEHFPFTFPLLSAVVNHIKTPRNSNNFLTRSKPPALCSASPFHVLFHYLIFLNLYF